MFYLVYMSSASQLFTKLKFRALLEQVNQENVRLGSTRMLPSRKATLCAAERPDILGHWTFRRSSTRQRQRWESPTPPTRGSTE
jgi:hypothetical protein